MTIASLRETVRQTAPCMPNQSLDVRDFLAQALSLPALDATAARLLAALNDSQTEALDLRDIVSSDMALAARLLKIANSAYYARPRSVRTIEQAIVLLGMDAVRNIAIAASLERMTRSGPVAGAVRRGDLWRHAIATAVHAQAIAERVQPELRNEAFLGGLLHDLGLLVALRLWPDALNQAAGHVAPVETGRSEHYLDAERALLGAPHTEYGAMLLEHWQFPDLVVEAVGAHHPNDVEDRQHTLLADVIHAADHVSACAGAGLHFELDDSPDPAALERIGHCWDDLRNLAETLQPQVQALSRHLSA